MAPQRIVSQSSVDGSLAVCAECSPVACSSAAQNGDRHGVSAVLARPEDIPDERLSDSAPHSIATQPEAATPADAQPSVSTGNGQHASGDSAASSAPSHVGGEPAQAVAAERHAGQPAAPASPPPPPRGAPRSVPRRASNKEPAELVPSEEIFFKRGDIVAGRVLWASTSGARVQLLKNPRIHGRVSTSPAGTAVS